MRRGDVVVFHYPVNPAQDFVKRVVAVPGDRLRLINKRVYINGAPVEEPYTQHITSLRNRYRDDFPATESPDFAVDAKWWKEMPKLVEDHQLIIPEGHYFVMGDNRDDSQDSRYWGFVPRENIVGRPLLIYWSSGNLSNDLSGTPSVGDRLYHLAYAVTHVFQITRTRWYAIRFRSRCADLSARFHRKWRQRQDKQKSGRKFIAEENRRETAV